MANIWDTFRAFPPISLAESTFLAFWRMLQQAGVFFRSTFGGEAGPWLLAAVMILVVAAGFNFVQSRMEARHVRHGRPRGGGYFSSLALLATAVVVLLAGRVVPTDAFRELSFSQPFGEIMAGLGAAYGEGYPQPGQRPVFFILLVVSVLHLAWFAGDLFCYGLKWEAGCRYFLRILRNRTAYYMILPTFIILGIFLYTPALTIFYYSFYAYDMGGTKELIGLGNYSRLLGDEIFWKSAGNMAILTTMSVFLSLAVPLVVAELIFHLKTERIRYYLRAAFLIPMVVPGVVMFLIWGYFYSDAGLIPLFGHAIGLGDALEGLLSRPQTALYAVIFVGFPFVMGINLLIFYAGLSNIDEAVWEAARMDGAKPFRRFLLIDLPLLTRQFKLLLILGIIGGVQAFENVLVMTQGGPGWQTMLPGLYMYRSAMSFNEYGFACAVGVTLFLLVLVLSLAVNRGVPTTKA